MSPASRPTPCCRSEMDDTDRAILRITQANAALSTAAIGRAVGLSQGATWRRLDRLRKAGILTGRELSLDLERLGFGVTVFLGVKLATKGRVDLDGFERAVSAIPEVRRVEHVLGRYD